MRVLHNNILYVAIGFHEFCARHDLKYFLLGGTALGAERHGGFIPWDDDFDVCMPKEDYMKLLKLHSEFFGTGLFLQREQTEELPLYFSKVRLDNSTYLEVDDFGRAGHQGVYIDVMCLTPCYPFKFLTFIQFLASKILSARALHKRGYKNARAGKRIGLAMASLMPRYLTSVLCKIARNEFNFLGSDYVHFFGRAPFSKGIIRGHHLSGSTVLFEGFEFLCFHDNRGYLRSRFGPEFMKSPSQSVRDQYPPHCVEFKAHPDLMDEL